MLKAYKVAISLAVVAHLGGFLQATFNPTGFLVPFGAAYDATLLRITVQFGFLLLVLAAFQALAAVWTFMGKREGIQLGLAAGLGMALSAVPDLALVRTGVDAPLVAIGVLTTLFAFLALRSEPSPRAIPHPSQAS